MEQIQKISNRFKNSDLYTLIYIGFNTGMRVFAYAVIENTAREINKYIEIFVGYYGYNHFLFCYKSSQMLQYKRQ